jgi:hypothetical protein
MPTPNTQLLQMHFIYKDTNIRDDELKVERVVQTPALAEPMFKIAFTATTNSGTRVTYRSYLNRRGLETYIHSTLKSLRVDHDPFDIVQVSSSVYPSFMYKVDDMGWEIRDTIMDVVMTTINSDVTRVGSHA